MTRPVLNTPIRRKASWSFGRSVRRDILERGNKYSFGDYEAVGDFGFIFEDTTERICEGLYRDPYFELSVIFKFKVFRIREVNKYIP